MLCSEIAKDISCPKTLALFKPRFSIPSPTDFNRRGGGSACIKITGGSGPWLKRRRVKRTEHKGGDKSDTSTLSCVPAFWEQGIGLLMGEEKISSLSSTPASPLAVGRVINPGSPVLLSRRWVDCSSPFVDLGSCQTPCSSQCRDYRCVHKHSHTGSDQWSS